MKHAKFTPGPWTVVHDEECKRICIDDANGHFASPVCELSLSDTTPHAEANARLVAAAPEMYELLLDIACTNNVFAEHAKQLVRKVKGGAE